MRLYTRKDFIQLPKGSIYSRVNPHTGEFWEGLYCKTTGPEDDWHNDWLEQELIASPLHPKEITDGGDINLWIEDQRDTLQQLRNDYNYVARDGFFDDSDRFMVWDRTDILKLTEYLLKRVQDER